MSLQIWLPLCGNSRNYGIADMSATSDAFVNGGKIGPKGFTNGTIKAPATVMSETFNNKTVSIAFWIYINADAGTTDGATHIIGNSSMTPPNNRKFTIFNYPSVNDLHWSWQNETNSTYISGVQKGVLPSYKWTHIIFTYDNPNGKLYINGKYIVSFSGISASDTFNYETIVAHCSTAQILNDVRIYNHCLSKKEIAEISKGLILHYPLNNNGCGGRNLITTMTSGGRTSLIDKYTLDADFSQNLDTYGYFNVSPALELDTPYTLSFDVSNFPEGSKWTWQLWNKAYYGFSVTGNGHYTYTFTPTASQLPDNYSLTKFLFDDGSRTGPANIVRFSNFKIEAGTQATMWAPNPVNFFEDGLQIEETSGYNRPGAAVQTMNVSTDTPRYDLSTIWKDSVDFISIPNFLNVNDTIDEITICGWFKTDTLNSTAPNLFNFGANSFIRGRIAGNASLWSYWNINGTKVGVSATVGTTTDNKWHHYAFVFSNGIIKTYFDGVLKNTSDQSETGTVLLCGSIAGWGLGGYTATGEKFIGQQSDFRTYATALTDTEILEIFEGRPGVDKNGNFYVGQLQENSAVAPLISTYNTANVPQAFYEPGGMNLAYNTEPYDYNGVVQKYTPKVDTNNSCLSGYKVWYGEELNGKRARATITVTWSGFDSSSTAGTFAMRFQGGQLTAAGGTSWTAATGKSNRTASAFASAQSLTSLVLGAESGTKTITVEYKISAVADQPGDWVGIRTDYSNGTGWIQLSDINVTLLEATADDEQRFKISKENIAANYIYEI